MWKLHKIYTFQTIYVTNVVNSIKFVSRLSEHLISNVTCVYEVIKCNELRQNTIAHTRTADPAGAWKKQNGESSRPETHWFRERLLCIKSL